METWIGMARAEEKEEILQLYQAQIGREYCPWNEDYPGMEEIDFDLSRESLFVMKNEKNEIIAAISIDQDESVEKLDCWTQELLPGGELARLAVCPKLQNQGIAREMIAYGMAVLRERGYKSVHFLVNKTNEKALRSYRHLHFQRVGECWLYEQPFWCYEKEIKM